MIYATSMEPGGRKAYKKLRFIYADDDKKEILLTRTDISDIIKERKQREEQEQKQLRYLENMPIAACTIKVLLDEKGEQFDFLFTYCNPAHERLEGVQRGVLVGKNFYQFFENTDPKWLKYYYETAWLGITHEIRDYSPEIGKELLIYTTQPELGYCDCVLLDITKETFLTRELHRNREEMKRILESTTALVFQYDPEKRTASINEFNGEDCNYTLSEEALLQHMQENQIVEADGISMIRDCFSRMCMGEHYLSAAVHARKSCEFPWIWYKMPMFDYQDEDTNERKILGYLQNINENMARQEQLRKAAQTDALTGILNVGGGKEKIQKILADREGNKESWNAMFLFDVDNFKTVNDMHGHMVGDDTLKQLAQILKESFEKGDVVFRLGGDEFAAFVKGMASPEAEIARRTKRIRAGVTAAKEKYPFLGISTGIYLTNVPNDYKHYYAEADRALYETKNQGKGHATIRKETKDGIVQ